MTEKKEKKKLNLNPVTFLKLTVAGIINAVGVTLFISPAGLYDSGISGTSMLLANITPEQFSLSLFLLVLNIPLFLYGLKKKGVEFTVYAIFTVAVYSIFAWIITDILPTDLLDGSPIVGDDTLLSAVFGGIISGIGSGLAIRFGGAMDGIEVMSVIYAKKLGVTVGTFVMVYNTVLYIICGIVMGSFIPALYSIITYMAALKTIDYIVEGLDRSKSVFIVTTDETEICKNLSETFEQGMTIINGEGYYSHSDKKIIYIVLNRFQISKMREIVHECDPLAYISISDVADVFKANQDK